jgi:uncharacterized protein YndB with AHSA1/START domain
VATSGHRTRLLPAPVERVWEALEAFDEIAAWAPKVVDHSSTMGGPGGGVGAARRIQSGRNVLIETVEAWDPPKRLLYRLDGLPGPIRRATNEWTLEAQADATVATLTTTVEVGPRPPHRLVERIALTRMAKVSDGLLDGLAAHLAEPRSTP